MYATGRCYLSRLALLLLALALGSSAWAVSLQEAKEKGLVGETPTGYLEVISGNGEAKALVERVNAERRSQYAAIAKRNGTQLNAVEKLAGKKAIEKTESGHYVRLPSGEWVKK